MFKLIGKIIFTIFAIKLRYLDLLYGLVTKFLTLYVYVEFSRCSLAGLPLSNFELIRDFMAVLVTCDNDDQKNKGTTFRRSHFSPCSSKPQESLMHRLICVFPGRSDYFSFVMHCLISAYTSYSRSRNSPACSLHIY